jgi:Ca2+-binding EF-hand superfamily protein
MDPLPKLVTDLFKVVALEESDIERLRQFFSHMREFTMNQRALFEIFDTTKDGKVTPDEMMKFLKDNLVNAVNLDDCREIIAEFDST